MLDLYLRPQKRSSLMQRYGDQFGYIVERKLTEMALVAAKQEAERFRRARAGAPKRCRPGGEAERARLNRSFRGVY